MDSDANIATATKRMQDAGLVVHCDGSSRFQFHRPTMMPGNRREGYKQTLIGLKGENLDVTEVLDAPLGGLFRLPNENGGGWAFRIWDWCPGPGPGDFEIRYPSLEEGVDAVLEYYFGDPSLMCDEYDEFRRTRSCT